MKDDVLDGLEKLCELRKNRNAVYGNIARKKGYVMKALFGELSLKTEDDFARYGTLDTIVSKLLRYANNFEKGGHIDSLNDISVYAQILRSLDEKKD